MIRLLRVFCFGEAFHANDRPAMDEHLNFGCIQLSSATSILLKPGILHDDELRP